MLRNCAGLLSTSCHCVLFLCCFRKYGKSQMGILLYIWVCWMRVCVSVCACECVYLISLSKRYIDISHSIMTFDLCFSAALFLLFLWKKSTENQCVSVHGFVCCALCTLKVISNLFVMCNKMMSTNCIRWSGDCDGLHLRDWWKCDKCEKCNSFSFVVGCPVSTVLGGAFFHMPRTDTKQRCCEIVGVKRQAEILSWWCQSSNTIYDRSFYFPYPNRIHLICRMPHTQISISIA